jgi:uncharacterized membrane protein YdjX (TVP38/TMEM64 family)
MPDDGLNTKKEERSFLSRWAPLLLLLALIALVIAMGWHRYLSLEVLAENRERMQAFVSANYLVAVLIFIGIYAAAVAMSLPGGLIMTVAGGFIFGPIFGGVIVVIAATIGATAIFLIARSALGDALAKRAGPRLDALRSGFQENALNYLLFLRLVPAFPFWLVNLAPAFLGVKLRTYVIGTFFGIMPGTFAFAFAGGGLDSIIESQQAVYDACVARQSGACEFRIDPSALVTTELLIAFAALGVVAIIPVTFRRFRGNPSAK